jgi:5-methylcytosine-specific restriction endonuclease McrA
MVVKIYHISKSKFTAMKNKTKIGSINKNFFKCPNAIFKANVSSSAIALYCYLCSLSENFDPGIKAITSVLKVSPKSAYKYINELIDNKIIEVIVEAGPNKRRIFAFTNPKTWKIYNKSVKQKRSSAEAVATPDWVNKKDFYKLKAECPDGMVLDHIIPITHDKVSGLHVPWNIQYLSTKENIQKSNKFDGTYTNEGWRFSQGIIK